MSLSYPLKSLLKRERRLAPSQSGFNRRDERMKSHTGGRGSKCMTGSMFVPRAGRRLVCKNRIRRVGRSWSTISAGCLCIEITAVHHSARDGD